MLHTIWQRFQDKTDLRNHNGWGLWTATYHQDMPEAEAKARLEEIEADELERRVRYPGTEAEYELRVSTKQPARPEGVE